MIMAKSTARAARAPRAPKPQRRRRPSGKPPGRPRQPGSGPHPVDTAWFRRRLAELDMTQAALAQAVDIDTAALSLLLRGRRRLGIEEVGPLARSLRVSPVELLRRAGVDSPADEVAIAGSVGSRGAITWTDTAHTVPLPPDAPSDAVALRCSAELSPLWRGWVLIAHARHESHTLDVVGRLAICQAEGDPAATVAHVERGIDRDRFDLTPPGGGDTLQDVRLAWAAPILWIRPT